LCLRRIQDDNGIITIIIIITLFAKEHDNKRHDKNTNGGSPEKHKVN